MALCRHLFKDDSETAIINAAVDGHEACIERLLTAGADVNAANSEVNDGDTALISAVKYMREKCVHLLIGAGADVDGRNVFGQTALHKAAEYGRHAYISVLLETGADVNGPDGKGKTPLMKACRYGHFKCVDLLITSGADVNVCSINGATALICASASNNLSVIYLLLKKGAFINMIKNERENALQYCLRHYKPNIKDVATLLYVAGEKLEGVTVKRKDDETAYVFRQRKEALDYLEECHFKRSFLHICRRAIRRHLITANPHTHLFHSVPLVGLPPALTSYVLFDMSLYPK